MTREQWQTVIDQDLNGFYNVLRATLPRLKAWGGGSYVHLVQVAICAGPKAT